MKIVGGYMRSFLASALFIVGIASAHAEIIPLDCNSVVVRDGKEIASKSAIIIDTDKALTQFVGSYSPDKPVPDMIPREASVFFEFGFVGRVLATTVSDVMFHIDTTMPRSGHIFAWDISRIDGTGATTGDGKRVSSLTCIKSNNFRSFVPARIQTNDNEPLGVTCRSWNDKGSNIYDIAYTFDLKRGVVTRLTTGDATSWTILEKSPYTIIFCKSGDNCGDHIRRFSLVGTVILPVATPKGETVEFEQCKAAPKTPAQRKF